MTMIFATGFEQGNLGALTAASSAAASTTQKRTGAYSMYIDSNADTPSITLPSTYTELYIQFGFYYTGYNGSLNGGNIGAGLIALHDAGGTMHALFSRHLSSGCVVYDNDNYYPTPVATGTVAITANTWVCVEIYFKLADSGGRVVVKLDGTTCLDFTGDTRRGGSGNIASVRWYGRLCDAFVSATGYYDDIIVHSTAGSVNNSWVGRCGIRPLLVNADGTNTGLTPSTGTDNYALVDEIPADDADYVSGSTADLYDLYTVDDSALPASYSVRAVKWIARAKVTEDAANITPVIRSESTTEQQADIALGTAFAEKSLLMETDPIDDAAWTSTKIAALEIGAAVG